MLSFTFLCHALPLIGFMGPLVNAAVYPFNDEPVHFSRSSSQTQSTTSSTRTATHSTSVHSSFTNAQPVPVVLRSFPLSQDGVNCQYHSFAQGPAPNGRQSSPNTVYGSPRRTLANLSPFNCHVQCLPPSPASPNKNDCRKIIKTMWKMNQRSITIEPQNSLYVSYRDCAIVFENRNSQNLAVMYQWNHLAQQADRIQSQCGNRSGAPAQQTGSCFFATCDVDKAVQASSTYGQTNGAGNTALASPSENSGVTISFQRHRSS